MSFVKNKMRILKNQLLIKMRRVYSWAIRTPVPILHDCDLVWNDWISSFSCADQINYCIEKYTVPNEDAEFRWVGASYYKRKVYAIANGASCCLVFDIDNHKFKRIGELPNTNFKWTGSGVWNGKIYGFPRTANELLIIDPNQNSVETINLGLHYNKEHHYGGVITQKGILYQPPRNTDHILKTDLNSNQVSKIRLPGFPILHRYCCSIVHPNGYIYFLPESNERVMVLDPKTDNIFFIGDPLHLMVFGAVVAHNGDIYGFSSVGTGLVHINTKDNTCEKLCTDIEFGSYGTEMGFDGNIYSIPGAGNTVYCFNPIKGKLSAKFEVEGNEKATCAGGVVSTEGNIYMVPAAGEYLYCLRSTKALNRKENFWMNNCY